MLQDKEKKVDLFSRSMEGRQEGRYMIRKEKASVVE